MASLNGTDQAMAPSSADGEGEADFASLLSAQSGGNRADRNQARAQNSFSSTISAGENQGGNGQDAGAVDSNSGEPTAFALRPSRLPQPSGEEIEAELAALSRGPFRRILTDYLGFAPTGPALQRFANKFPDKWANAVGILAQLAGYKKELQVEGTVQMVHTMSDSDIERRRKELQQLESASNRLIVPPPRTEESARKLVREEAPAPKISAELNPSRDDTIVDVSAKEIK